VFKQCRYGNAFILPAAVLCGVFLGLLTLTEVDQMVGQADQLGERCPVLDRVDALSAYYTRMRDLSDLNESVPMFGIRQQALMCRHLVCTMWTIII
jgi:hypothetical protein